MCKYFLLAFFSFSLATIVAQEKKVRLFFAGDAMQHTPQLHAAKTDSGYDYEPVFALIKNKIAKADIAGINLETTFGGKPYTGYPTFSSPEEYGSALHKAGFNVFFTANNHALDTGKKGLENTITSIKKLGAKQTGTFSSSEKRELLYPLMLIKNGIRMAFINYTYGTNGQSAKAPNVVNLIDTVLIKKDIDKAKLLDPDIIIAVLHWGEEYYTRPSRKQKNIAQFLFNNDVRLIIGHHPHVIQPIHTLTLEDSITHAVYYSLGNFVSNQRKQNTDGGMLAEIILSKADKNSAVCIESTDYSLVWVHKYFEADKPFFRILPIEKDFLSIRKGRNDNGFNLQPDEEATLHRFIKSANRIIKVKLED